MPTTTRPHPDDDRLIRLLLETRDDLMARAARIDEEIQALQAPPIGPLDLSQKPTHFEAINAVLTASPFPMRARQIGEALAAGGYRPIPQLATVLNMLWYERRIVKVATGLFTSKRDGVVDMPRTPTI
jgi:hypothetical protein